MAQREGTGTERERLEQAQQLFYRVLTAGDFDWTKHGFLEADLRTWINQNREALDAHERLEQVREWADRQSRIERDLESASGPLIDERKAYKLAAHDVLAILEGSPVNGAT